MNRLMCTSEHWERVNMRKFMSVYGISDSIAAIRNNWNAVLDTGEINLNVGRGSMLVID